jgi:Ser/Thr protein kinase RdoA (MazF antagonist)
MDFKVTVQHSLLTVDSIQDILVSYNLSKVISCEFLTRGLNDTYVISTQDYNYIFRVYRHNWRNESDILFEIDAINHLKESGFLTSYPIKTCEGRWVIKIQAPEGIRYGVLFTYSKGHRPEINPTNCNLIGKSLGELHNNTDNFVSNHARSFDLDLKHLLDEPLSLISPLIKKVLGTDQEQILMNTIETIKKAIRGSKLATGFCHGDFHNFNMHIDEAMLEIFDFDCCSFGYRSYDVAVFWWNLKNNYPSLEKECWGQFLNGYLSQRKLSDVEINSLPLFISVRRIWLVGTMLKNEDVWGKNWINKTNLAHFLTDLNQDKELYLS